MMLAGLISTRHHGPDMPLDAKVLARLPLRVLRRVLPELPPVKYALRAGRLINEVRALLPTQPQQEEAER